MPAASRISNAHVVVADAVHDEHVHRRDADHVGRLRRVAVRIGVGIDQRHDLGAIADDVRDEAVIRVQRDADLQRLGVGRVRAERASQRNEQRRASIRP